TYINVLPRNGHLGLEADINGTPSMLDIKRFYLRSNGVVELSAKGDIRNIFTPGKFGMNIDMTGRIQQSRGLMGAFLPADITRQYHIPPMTLAGHIRMSGENYSGTLNARTNGGSLALDGYFRGNAQAYSADIGLKQMPVNAFAPAYGIGRVTGHISAKGHGFDFFSKSTTADVSITIDSAAYNQAMYRNILMTASLAEGNADIRLDSSSPELDLHMLAQGNLSGDSYNWTASLNGDNIDLHALKLSETESKMLIALEADATYTPSDKNLGVNINLHRFGYNTADGNMEINNVTAHLNSSDSVTNASMQNRDFYAFFSSDSGLDSLVSHFGSASDELIRQTNERKLDVTKLQAALPPFVLDVNAGRDNLLTDILHKS
ncbi:MAG: hypothetical protein K2L80_07785, partial [Muribaculaceae bacterium]|nr:hypothetical protein [Muribaculaceae bacterium]